MGNNRNPLQPITLKFVLKGTIPSKKNNKVPLLNKAGKPYMTTSFAYKKWIKKMMPLFLDWLEKQQQKYPGLQLPITQKVKYKVLFYFGDDKDRDLGNKIETLNDVFVAAGVIINDSYRILSIESDGKYTKGVTRTEVYFTLKSLQNDPELVALYERRKKATEERKRKRMAKFIFTAEQLAE